jgi:hypothetical protein
MATIASRFAFLPRIIGNTVRGFISFSRRKAAELLPLNVSCIGMRAPCSYCRLLAQQDAFMIGIKQAVWLEN